MAFPTDSTVAWLTGHKSNPGFVYCHDSLEKDLAMSDSTISGMHTRTWWRSTAYSSPPSQLPAHFTQEAQSANSLQNAI